MSNTHKCVLMLVAAYLVGYNAPSFSNEVTNPVLQKALNLGLISDRDVNSGVAEIMFDKERMVLNGEINLQKNIIEKITVKSPFQREIEKHCVYFFTFWGTFGNIRTGTKPDTQFAKQSQNMK